VVIWYILPFFLLLEYPFATIWSKFDTLTIQKSAGYTYKRNTTQRFHQVAVTSCLGRIGESVQIRRSRATVTGKHLIASYTGKREATILLWMGRRDEKRLEPEARRPA
jgi:hypothetical protein